MLRSACIAWAYMSPTPTIDPSSAVAVVPETWTTFPTRTAREYPTTGSHRVPEEISDRMFERRETRDERRETRDERRETRDERRETRDERRETRDERRETSDERRETSD